MIIQVYDDDLLNGEGIREVIFLQGCPHHCKGCFSPETWEFKQETEESKEKDHNYLEQISKKLNCDYIDGITITGGDPLAPQNIEQAKELCLLAKSYNKTVWIYTGYLFDYVKNLDIVNYIDVLCEGPFKEELKSPKTPWVGSSNQRVINVKESLTTNTVVLW